MLLDTVEHFHYTTLTEMEQENFNYSVKNIPIPPRNTYIKKLIEKVESVIKRMRWKAFFYDNDNHDKESVSENQSKNKFGFKSRKCPPKIDEINAFESDLLKMVKNISFNNNHDHFQRKLDKDINKMKRSTKAFIPADKTRNHYTLDKQQYKKLLHDNITKAYKKADNNITDNLNKEAKQLSEKLKIDERVEILAKRPAFITLKDHKENFRNSPTCRLINPTKSELGKVSKKIVEKINNSIKQKTNLNQWQNSSSVIDWFSKIRNKHRHAFLMFDIENFYPSITEDLLNKSINFAKAFTHISDSDLEIIYHARKSLLFDDNGVWVKKDNSLFDVTMGSFDGAEICELVGLYLLSQITRHIDKQDIGLYRDDGLALLRNTNGPKAERLKKLLTKLFLDNNLKISIQANLQIVDYLDVTFNLKDNTFRPFRKPNDKPLYINAKSNHPPLIIKQLPQMINKRISSLSSNQEIFNNTKTIYEDALKDSGYNSTLTFNPDNKIQGRKNRSRQIIWFNPPFSKNVTTDIGRTFLKLIKKHFPASHKLNKIFNKNTVKVSYSCMDNIGKIIKQHNNKIISEKPTKNAKTCNCRTKNTCPLNAKCLATNIIYNAEVTTNISNTSHNYIGLTEGTFKNRLNSHNLSFTKEKYKNATELSKHIWSLKAKNAEYTVKWSKIATAAAYNNHSKRCNLCLTEKFYIITSRLPNLLNKRSELISKCRHENKFYLKNFKTRKT